ncbi:MAG: hypothetical protein V3W41_02960 [Planctomycetota bacterium]
MTGWLLFVPFALATVSIELVGREGASASSWRRQLLETSGGIMIATLSFALGARIILGEDAWSAAHHPQWGSLEAPLVQIVFAFTAFVGGMAFFESQLWRAKTAQVLTLILAYWLILAPFCLDGFIEAHQDAPSTDRWLARAATLSPPALLAQETYGLDLFRQERIYRDFMIGEQLLAPRDLKAALFSLFGVGFLAAVGGLVLNRLRGRKCERSRTP